MNVKLDNMTVMSITLTVQTHREVMIVTARKASLEMEKYALVSYSTVIKFIESYYPGMQILHKRFLSLVIKIILTAPVLLQLMEVLSVAVVLATC